MDYDSKPAGKGTPPSAIYFILRAQPVFAFAVFIAVLTGAPALWIAWAIAISPVLVRLVVTRTISRRTPLDVPIIISIVAALIGAWRGPDTQMAWTGLNTFLACVLLYFGIVNNAHAPKSYWVLWCSFITLVVLFLTISIFRGGAARYVVFNLWAYRLAANIHWPFAIPGSLNVTGDVCAIILPGLVSVALFRQKPLLRWAAAAAVVFFVFLMFISGSGGGWIVVTAALMLLLLRYNEKVFGATATILVGVIVLLVSFRSTAWESSVFHAANVTGRFEVWKGTIIAMMHYPTWILGFGLGGWWSKVPPDVLIGVNPHNAYLQLYSDTGIVGLVVLVIGLIMISRLIWDIWRADRSSGVFGVALGVAMGLMAFGLHALVEVNTNLMVTLGARTIYFAIPLIWIWLAFLVVAHRRLVIEKT